MFLPKTTLAEEHGLHYVPVASRHQHDLYRYETEDGRGIQQRFSLNPWEETQGQNINLSFANLDCSAIDGAGDQGNDFVDSFIKPKKFSPRPSPSLLQRIVDVQNSEKQYYSNQTEAVKTSFVAPTRVQEPVPERTKVLEQTASPVESKAKHPIYQPDASWRYVVPPTTSPTSDILARAQNILRHLERQTPDEPLNPDRPLLPSLSHLSQRPTPAAYGPPHDESFIAEHEDRVRHYRHVLSQVAADAKVRKVLSSVNCAGEGGEGREEVDREKEKGGQNHLDRKIEDAILRDVRAGGAAGGPASPAVGGSERGSTVVSGTWGTTNSRVAAESVPTTAARSVLEYEHKPQESFIKSKGLDQLVGQLDMLKRVYATNTRIPEDLMTSDKQQEALKAREREALAAIPIPDISDILIPVKGHQQQPPKQRAERHSVRIDYIEEWLMKPDSKPHVQGPDQLTREYQQFDQDIERIIQNQERNASGAQDLLRKLTLLNQDHQKALSTEVPYVADARVPDYPGDQYNRQRTHQTTQSDSNQTLSMMPHHLPPQSADSPTRQISGRRVSHKDTDSPEVQRQVSPNRIGVIPASAQKSPAFNLPVPAAGASTRVDVQPVVTELASGYVLLNSAGQRLLSPYAIASTRLNHIPKDKFKERKLNQVCTDDFAGNDQLFVIPESEKRDLPTPEEIKSKEAELNSIPKVVERQSSDYSMPTPTNMVADPEMLTRGIQPITPPEGVEIIRKDPSMDFSKINPSVDEKLASTTDETPTHSVPEGPQQLPITEPQPTPIPAQPQPTETPTSANLTPGHPADRPITDPTVNQNPNTNTPNSNTTVPPLALSTLPSQGVRTVRSPNRITLSSSPRSSDKDK